MTPLLPITSTLHLLWLVGCTCTLGSPLVAGDRPAAAVKLQINFPIDRLIMLVPREILRCKPADPAMQVDAIRGTGVCCACRYRRCGNCATDFDFVNSGVLIPVNGSIPSHAPPLKHVHIERKETLRGPTLLWVDTTPTIQSTPTLTPNPNIQPLIIPPAVFPENNYVCLSTCIST